MRLDFKIEFECKRSNKILSVGIKYFMRNLIRGVINYCASNFAMKKIKRIRSNLKWKTWKGKDMDIKQNLHDFLSDRWFTNGIHSL